MARKKHDFFAYMESIKKSMSDEYALMRSRALEDPGTAGDQAEELWATFFRNWLPANYPIETKGRLINETGDASPQVDIVVLHPSYPRHLRHIKHFFMGGVVAAFECKLTLRGRDLRKAFETAAIVKRMNEARTGTLYDELNSLPIFGLLSHSHGWRSSETMYEKMHGLQGEFAEHPREMLDVVCVADTGTYFAIKDTKIGPHGQYPDDFWEEDKEGVSTAYCISEEPTDSEFEYDYSGRILGTLVYEITKRMAYEDHSLRPFATYLSQIGAWGGIYKAGLWTDVLSPEIAAHVMEYGFDDSPFSKWAQSPL